MEKIKIAIGELSIIRLDLIYFQDKIKELVIRNRRQWEIVILYRQILVCLKNAYDFFNKGFEQQIGIDCAKIFSKEKRKLIKLLKPYNKIRNNIGGHLDKKILKTASENINFKNLLFKKN